MRLEKKSCVVTAKRCRHCIARRDPQQTAQKAFDHRHHGRYGSCLQTSSLVSMDIRWRVSASKGTRAKNHGFSVASGTQTWQRTWDIPSSSQLVPDNETVINQFLSWIHIRFQMTFLYLQSCSHEMMRYSQSQPGEFLKKYGIRSGNISQLFNGDIMFGSYP